MTRHRQDSGGQDGAGKRWTDGCVRSARAQNRTVLLGARVCMGVRVKHRAQTRTGQCWWAQTSPVTMATVRTVLVGTGQSRIHGLDLNA